MYILAAIKKSVLSKKVLTTTLLLFFVSILSAQEYRQSLFLQVDNDLYFGRDKYYSSGIIVGYSKSLQNDFIFNKRPDETLQLDIKAGHLIFTPGDIDATDTRFFDRPFAGWLFVETGLSKASENSILRANLEIGLTGNASFGEDIQVWYHRILGIEEEPSWQDQIPGELLANFKPSFIYSEVLNDMTFLDFVSNGSLGTKDMYAEQMLGVTYGRRNQLSESSAFGMMGTSSKPEFFGFFRAGYRFVGHDTFLEGSPLNDHAKFTVDPKEHLFKIDAGGNFNIGKHLFSAVYHFNTKSSKREDAHYFLEIVYRLRF